MARFITRRTIWKLCRAARIAEAAARKMYAGGLLSSTTRARIDADLAKGWPRYYVQEAPHDFKPLISIPPLITIKIEDTRPKDHLTQLILRKENLWPETPTTKRDTQFSIQTVINTWWSPRASSSTGAESSRI